MGEGCGRKGMRGVWERPRGVGRRKRERGMGGRNRRGV